MTDGHAAERAQLMDFALGFPQAYLDHPWGEDVVKVRGKIFAFFGMAGPDLSVGVKLPLSSMLAVAQPFVEPSGYGLGKAGWVTASYPAAEPAPVDLLRDWITESYRAVAPRTLVATLDRPA